jgi:hypothetical protein
MFPQTKTLSQKCSPLVPEVADAANTAAFLVQWRDPFLYTLGRFADGNTAVLPLDVRHCCHATSIGAATAMDEYVPIRMPTTSANENPRSTSPPKM